MRLILQANRAPGPGTSLQVAERIVSIVSWGRTVPQRIWMPTAQYLTRREWRTHFAGTGGAGGQWSTLPFLW